MALSRKIRAMQAKPAKLDSTRIIRAARDNSLMLVVDANVVTKWFVDQVHSDRAERVQTSKQRLIAPQLMIAEVTDALRKHVRVGDISVDQARTAVASLPRWFNEIVAMEQLADAALDLARKLEHSAYDCFYLALAESRSARS